VGVGRATALDLARRGANVVINYSRSEDDAREAVRLVEAEGGSALLVKADVSKDDQVRGMVAQAVDRFGGLHILVNNAATTHFVAFPDLEGMKEEYWDDIYAVNVKGSFFCARAAAPEIKKSGGGAIVNVASVAGLVGLKNRAAYSASKGAVIALTRALAVDHVGDGIRVNAVCPGTIDTPWVQRLVADAGESLDALRARQPMGRLGTPDEVADAVLYLATATFATGTILTVDGGLTAA
jgi:3-oxoacyl-[acyl-carrier protein] reductase